MRSDSLPERSIHGKSYKMSAVGRIPEDWEVSPLGQSLSGRPRYGINAASVPFSDRLPAYIRITDITSDGRFAPDERVSVDAADSASYLLSDGDIVFARTGASVGKSYRYRTQDGPLVFAGFLIRVRPDDSRLLPEYLAAYAATDTYWAWVRLMSMRSGQPGINGNEYAQLPVPLPSIHEQGAIAAALSDVDALIGSLDRLIAKKRDLEQTVAQQLITGQTRLAGFGAPWDTRPLRSLLEHISNGAVYKPVHRGGVPVTRIETIATGKIDYARVGFARRESGIERYVLRKGDILFSHINSIDHIGKVAIVPSNELLFHGMNLLLLRAAHEHDGVFLYYWLSSEHARRQMRVLAKQAVSQASINISELGSVEIPVPTSSEEQRAIAAVLSDMDAEIAALEQRRDKTRLLKQAMMQELLTGRTRLV